MSQVKHLHSPNKTDIAIPDHLGLMIYPMGCHSLCNYTAERVYHIINTSQSLVHDKGDRLQKTSVFINKSEKNIYVNDGLFGLVNGLASHGYVAFRFVPHQNGCLPLHGEYYPTNYISSMNEKGRVEGISMIPFIPRTCDSVFGRDGAILFGAARVRKGRIFDLTTQKDLIRSIQKNKIPYFQTPIEARKILRARQIEKSKVLSAHCVSKN